MGLVGDVTVSLRKSIILFRCSDNEEKDATDKAKTVEMQ